MIRISGAIGVCVCVCFNFFCRILLPPKGISIVFVDEICLSSEFTKGTSTVIIFPSFLFPSLISLLKDSLEDPAIRMIEEQLCCGIAQNTDTWESRPNKRDPARVKTREEDEDKWEIRTVHFNTGSSWWPRVLAADSCILLIFSHPSGS